MKLSIVATLYRSESYVNEFYERASSAAKELVGDEYEIIFVNDGSPDNSLNLAIELTKHDTHIVIVDLSRNFGHHQAMMTGLEHSIGEKVFLLDSDLEEEPEWLTKFSKVMSNDFSDVVYGRQETRKGGWFERWSGEVFYSLFNWLSDIDHPKNIVTARLMTRRYVDALLRYKEREMVISCLWVITGFKQTELLVKKHMSSSTNYSLSKKVTHAVNAITSFSAMPLKFIFYIGLLIFVVSLFFAGYLVFNKLFLSHSFDGWTSVMVSIWLLGGMVISFVGVIGIYLAKIFVETKQRPLAIVRSVYGK
jgi:putative glycosyltransferase